MHCVTRSVYFYAGHAHHGPILAVIKAYYFPFPMQTRTYTISSLPPPFFFTPFLLCFFLSCGVQCVHVWDRGYRVLQTHRSPPQLPEVRPHNINLGVSNNNNVATYNQLEYLLHIMRHISAVC